MAACVVPSYIVHNVFSYFDIHYQLWTLARVCKAWHHAAMCMNCINTNVTVQDVKQWFAKYFDTEIVDLLICNFKSIIGAPYSYVVRNLVLQVMRDIQEAVPNIEIEIFMLYSQLAKAQKRSEKLLKVFQVSALLYLLKKIESTFNIYDIFNNIDLALGQIQIPICKRNCLKMLIHVGAMLRFRFDQNSPHITDNDFHVRAAIKCFDVKLLIKKSPPWIPIFELLEATIGSKFLRPDTVFPNFAQKLVEICKNDFSDFNELLSMMESDLALDSDEESDNVPSEMKVPRTGITKFPVITNEFLSHYVTLQPSDYCDKNHSPSPRTDSPSDPSSPSYDNDSHDSHDSLDPHDPHDSHDSHNTSTRSSISKSGEASDTPSKYTTNNNNYTPPQNISQSKNTPNTAQSSRASNIDMTAHELDFDEDMEEDDIHDNNDGEDINDKAKQQSDNNDKFANIPKSPKYNNTQSSLLTANPQHETTVINHAETKTNNDESTASTKPAKEASGGSATKRPVEDYKYFFDSEENSLDDDEELVDPDDFEEFEDDEKENEPPAKFVKVNTTNTPDKCNVRH